MFIYLIQILNPIKLALFNLFILSIFCTQTIADDRDDRNDDRFGTGSALHHPTPPPAEIPPADPVLDFNKNQADGVHILQLVFGNDLETRTNEAMSSRGNDAKPNRKLLGQDRKIWINLSKAFPLEKISDPYLIQNPILYGPMAGMEKHEDRRACLLTETLVSTLLIDQIDFIKPTLIILVRRVQINDYIGDLYTQEDLVNRMFHRDYRYLKDLKAVDIKILKHTAISAHKIEKNLILQNRDLFLRHLSACSEMHVEDFLNSQSFRPGYLEIPWIKAESNKIREKMNRLKSAIQNL